MNQDPVPKAKIPSATYRLQFNAQFTFAAAREIVGYLRDLGISDVYASSYLQAKAGSLHGYDVVNQTVLNREVGDEGSFQGFVEELQRAGMGQILDFVPNHMCIESVENLWWMDVLENGPSSPHAHFFDIEWEPVKKELTGKVLLPFLGDQYGRVLEKGELHLSFQGGAFAVDCSGLRIPLEPKSCLQILGHRPERLHELFPAESAPLQEFYSIMTSLQHLPGPTEQNPEQKEERHREKEIIKRRLSRLCQEIPAIAGFIEENLAIFNGTKGEPHSFDLLDRLLQDQVYRLSYWRVATEEINYRRFFDINGLAAIRMEDPAVFEQTHALLFRLIRERKVTGVRIDHVDGLYDPLTYLQQLQRCCYLQLAGGGDAECADAAAGAGSAAEVPAGAARVGSGAGTAEAGLRDSQSSGNYSRSGSPLPEGEGQGGGAGAAGQAAQAQGKAGASPYQQLLDRDPAYRPFYTVVEKILMKGEQLPREWPVFGSTGYDFVSQVNGIFVDTEKAKAFDRIYDRYLGYRSDFNELVYEKKKLVMQVSLSGEANMLGHRLNNISETDRLTRDFTLNSLVRAISEVIACFPVYRTYVIPGTVREKDVQYIDAAVARAKRKNPAMNSSVFDFLRDVLLLRFPEQATESDRNAWIDFAMHFQQITGPVMAKGLEDTAFYVYNRLVSLNDVGGMPGRFGTPLEAFHGQNLERLKTFPHAMITLSTHDSKRGEDVRARINALSEVPDQWQKALMKWSRLNRSKGQLLEGQRVPSRNEEYLLYQTLVGTWPLEEMDQARYEEYRNRIREYQVKAAREAKVNTSWISPNAAYEAALTAFGDAVLAGGHSNAFLEEFIPFQKMIARFGVFNSLSQSFLKIVSPGVPDFYQGTELWAFTLVDPDNRKPVDYRVRVEALAGLKAREAEIGPLKLIKELLESREDGRIKLYLTYRVLNFRRDNRELFDDGEYLPLEAQAARARNLAAFLRRGGGKTVIAAAPRFLATLAPEPGQLPLGEGAWLDTLLDLPEGAAGRYRNVITGEELNSTEHAGKQVLPLARVFGIAPVALLERQ
jgi:(1->4)-alpha-D-glucan 1-alpha-D-glucosylmutase